MRTKVFLRLFPVLAMLLVLAFPGAAPVFAQEEVPPAAELDEQLAAPDELEGTLPAESPDPVAPAEADEPDFVDHLNEFLNQNLGKVTDVLNEVLFFSILEPIYMLRGETAEERAERTGFPFVVAVLIFGGLFFTFWLRFINFRAFRHSLDVIRGHYNDPAHPGEVTHFRALTSALSATVGLGNIAGVAIAIQLGGPGAVFWMTIGGLLGMSLKFAECTLGQRFRKINEDGSVSGGPMYYLERGFATMSPPMAVIGKLLAVMFAIMVMIAAFGIGNMFQANQSFASFSYSFSEGPYTGSIYGVVMAFAVGIVVLGGIRRIGAATSKLVPFMAGLYMLACLTVIIVHLPRVPEAILTILRMAFSDAEATYGGVIGVIIMGFRRGVFSNEAGLGSAPIAHSAARTNEPVREGVVSLMEPFIDTVIICNMTALVIILTGVWADPEISAMYAGQGIMLTNAAFEGVMGWFPYVLTICVILFAYSTMISWCYYGERGWIYIVDHFGEGLGLKTVNFYRAVFVVFIYIGAVTSLDAIIDFSDSLNLTMALPNIIGCLILAPLLTKMVNDYWKRYQLGEMEKTNAGNGGGI